MATRLRELLALPVIAVLALTSGCARSSAAGRGAADPRPVPVRLTETGSTLYPLLNSWAAIPANETISMVNGPAALDSVLAEEKLDAGELLGTATSERTLRFGLERCYRAQARLAADRQRRVELVDLANDVRPSTWS